MIVHSSGRIKILLIHQTSDTAIVEWKDFTISVDETARFSQPSQSSTILSRVIVRQPSEIYGTLQSNGMVYLINQNGILIGPSGKIDTSGGFLASTLNLVDAEFLSAGEMNFPEKIP